MTIVEKAFLAGRSNTSWDQFTKDESFVKQKDEQLRTAARDYAHGITKNDTYRQYLINAFKAGRNEAIQECIEEVRANDSLFQYSTSMDNMIAELEKLKSKV